jgi:putative FmdB family regulatory protein
MPNYDYRCDACGNSFERFFSIAERDRPVSSPCPSCGKKRVRRAWIAAPLGGVDATLKPGSDFKEVIERIKRGVPAAYREGLDRSTEKRGTRYGPQ